MLHWRLGFSRDTFLPTLLLCALATYLVASFPLPKIAAAESEPGF